MPMAQIIYFSKTNATGPSSRYRIYQFLPLLEKKGISVKVSPLFGETYFKILAVKNNALRFFLKSLYTGFRFFLRLIELVNVSTYSGVIVEHQIFPYLPAFMESFFLKGKKNIYLEFDDAIYLTPFHGRKMMKLLPLYSGIIAGNSNLAQYANRYNKRVLVHPTLIDTSKYRLKEDYSTKDKIVIGWIGLDWNLKYLKSIEPALRNIASKHNVLLRIIAAKRIKIEGVEIDFKTWDLEDETDDIRAFDIGIMPLNDDEWCRGKCGLKLLQYMAAGVPSVCSPVGVNSEIVIDGENGFLAHSNSEWEEKISALIVSEVLREKIGRNGHKTVEAVYSLDKRGIEILSFYDSVSTGKVIFPSI